MKSPNDEIYKELFQLALNRLQDGEVPEGVKEHLLRRCDDIAFVTALLQDAKNTHHAELRKKGFRFVLFGCITSFSGLLITIINFNTNRSIDLAMYGLTSAGIIIVFWGLIKIIG